MNAPTLPKPAHQQFCRFTKSVPQLGSPLAIGRPAAYERRYGVVNRFREANLMLVLKPDVRRKVRQCVEGEPVRPALNLAED